jgi:hypothetical protein
MLLAGALPLRPDSLLKNDSLDALICVPRNLDLFIFNLIAILILFLERDYK